MSDSVLANYYPDRYWGEEPTRDWIMRSQSEKTGFLAGCKLTGGRILDVGCGSGYFLLALDENRWERFGVEVGAEAVSAARMHLGEEKIVEGSLTDSSFEEGSFDVVTFWSALEHMNYPSRALAEAKRILKPSGKLIVQVPNADSYQARYFKGSWFALDAPRHRYHFSQKVLERLLNHNGFTIERITLFSKEHNAHALRQSLKSTLSRGPYLLVKPFTTPVDNLLSRRGHGATITLAARKI
jgi:2-polyprenyl-3-methyl-5-hydroxy-6-metoxy-1,4-benzoquinol methylase